MSQGPICCQVAARSAFGVWALFKKSLMDLIIDVAAGSELSEREGRVYYCINLILLLRCLRRRRLNVLKYEQLDLFRAATRRFVV